MVVFDKKIKGCEILMSWLEKSKNKELLDLVECYEYLIFENNKKDMRLLELEMQVSALTRELMIKNK